MGVFLRVTVLTVTIGTALLPCQSYAADWIGDFYNSAGAGVNVTAPQAITSQSVIGHTGGGVSWRIPNKTFAPIQITPPSLSSGCGGIDFYLGSYSFPNKDAFVQALRNFGQASIGYFFTLALSTMAPEIEGALAKINKIAQEVNGLNMGSCAAAKKSVDFIADQVYAATEKSTAGQSVVEGVSVDQQAGIQTVQEDGYWDTVRKRYKQITNGRAVTSLTAADAGKFVFPRMNVLRWAIEHAHATDLVEDEKDLIMSLIGPTLILSGKSDNSGTQAPAAPGKGKTLDFKDLVGLAADPLVPTPLKILTCDTQQECLGPYETTIAIDPFATRIQKVINSIRTNIVNRDPTTFTPQQQTVLRLTSVPILRAAAMAESGGAGGLVTGALVADLRDFAAMDAAANMVYYYLGITEKALAEATPKIPEAYAPEVKRMNNRIKVIKDDIKISQDALTAAKGNPLKQLEQLEKAERYMYSNLNTMLSANARFRNRN